VSSFGSGAPVLDRKRARAFYEGVLGLKVSQEPGVVPWMEFDLGNTTLGLSDGTTITLVGITHLAPGSVV